MVIELSNVLLLKFEDRFGEDENLLVSAKLLKDIDPKSLHGIPVYFRRGAIKIHIGFVNKARRGREAIYGDLILDLEGDLDVEVEVVDNLAKGLGFTYVKVQP